MPKVKGKRGKIADGQSTRTFKVQDESISDNEKITNIKLANTGMFLEAQRPKVVDSKLVHSFESTTKLQTSTNCNSTKVIPDGSSSTKNFVVIDDSWDSKQSRN